MCLKDRCYKEGAQHVFDTFLRCCSHWQMFSYHHVTYFCSDLSLVCSDHKKHLTDQMSYLLTFNWNSNRWLWHRTQEGAISVVLHIKCCSPWCLQISKYWFLNLKIAILMHFFQLINCSCLSKVLLDKITEKLLCNTTIWDLSIQLLIHSGIFCKTEFVWKTTKGKKGSFLATFMILVSALYC